MIYELSRKAQRQIEDIIRYTDHKFGEDQTNEYVAGLYHSFDILSDNPKMGRQYDKRRRRYICRIHQVYYRLFKNRILIVDIRSSRQKAALRRIRSAETQARAGRGAAIAALIGGK